MDQLSLWWDEAGKLEWCRKAGEELEECLWSEETISRAGTRSCLTFPSRKQADLAPLVYEFMGKEYRKTNKCREA